jgi:mannose-6-phosphate isomerase-like protein (cupin superfamily)
MKTIAIEDGKIIKHDSGVTARAIYSAPEAMLVHIFVEPGGVVATHVTPIDMEFFVLEGRGIFILGDESVEAGPNVLIPSPKGIPHGIRNPGRTPLRVLAVKNPRPADEA